MKRSPEQIVSRLGDCLGLNDAQVASMQPAIAESIEQRRQVLDKYKEEGRAMMLSMRDEMTGFQQF